MKHELLQYLQNTVMELSVQGYDKFVDGLKSIIDKYDEPLTATGGGIVGDTCTIQPFDYVAEAKRQTLHHLLISVAERNGGLTATGAAGLVNEGYAALERQPDNDELTAALLTISNIQNALDLPGKKGISEEVIELVERLQLAIAASTGVDRFRTQSVTNGPTTDLDFGRALQWMDAGYAVARHEWLNDTALRRLKTKGKGIRDTLVTFDLAKKLPDFTGYVPTQDDLLATDWYALTDPR
ncbi:hypothetical protein HWC14_gp09 [Serratia phage Parlo]|uniref:Thoeris anti-defense 2-like domain-containing protein n=1 Tax=Serratia phage Parlo TaxID=2557554 RepID=A0A482MG12_9CAUD|nr:hypothetical protein HWC14_gp09 [Serratia phage Parlo]QBQ72158.1 hypothetical protein CPT_Parlo_009 [Serratia phage Parlo]